MCSTSRDTRIATGAATQPRAARCSSALASASAVAVALTLIAACTTDDAAEIGGVPEGGACVQASDCEAGFDCVEKTCTAMAPGGGGPQRGDCCDSARYLASFPGGNCDAPVTCPDPLVCGTQGACTFFGGVGAGERCGLDIDCIAPLACHGNRGVCVDPSNPNPNCVKNCSFDPSLPKTLYCDANDNLTPCDPTTGVRDIDEPCGAFTDCRKPYICALGSVPSTCQKLPFFAGPDCVRSEEESGWFRVYYEVPPETIEQPFEFYRLPFPNDIRVVDGHIDLEGHAAPGEILGIDVAGGILGTIERDADGFALNSPIFFRLTDPPTPESVCLGPGGQYLVPPPAAADGTPLEWCPGGGPASVYLVDVTPGGGFERIPLQMSFTRERGQYACGNLLGIGPLDGHPLRPGTTYAAVVTTGLRDVRGDPPIRDFDFECILDQDFVSSQGITCDLPQHAIDATEPLRAWLAADSSVDAGDIAAATVFTTGNPSAVGPRLHAAVNALADAVTPKFNGDAFECASAPALFPCHGNPPLPQRSCGAADPAFYEIHGTYDAPAFQEGTRPYLVPELGGSMDIEDPQRTKTEVMCYSLTIPKTPAAPPAGGWPVVIIGHGTGGNYRSFTGGRKVLDVLHGLGFAVIGFDNSMHDPRQDPNTSDDNLWDSSKWLPPENLFFNVINAPAARDNVLQGAADLFHLTRLLHEEGLGNTTPPLSANGISSALLAFNPAQIFYFGHSQGTTIVYPFLVEDDLIKAAVLSGGGAELALSILSKKKPVDIAAAAGAAFADNNLTRLHPMMGLLAQMFAPSDAISWTDKVFFGRPELDPPRRALPILLFSGVGDTYSPDATQDALIASMGIPIVPFGETVSNNITSPDGTRTVTGGAVRLTPVGYDGHFVAFQHDLADEILRHFMQTALAGGTVEVQR